MTDLGDQSATGPDRHLEILVLGPLQVRRGGDLVRLPGHRHGQLLAELVLHRGHRVAIETLVDHIWGERPPATAIKLIHKYVSELRRVLGTGVDGLLRTDGPGYVMDVPGDAIDAVRFEALVDAAQKLPDAEAVDALRRAETLWRGRALDDIADLHHIQPVAQRLEERRLTAIERRLTLMVELGHHRDALPELEQLTIEHPLREALWAQLMLARHAAGRRADALDAYQRLRQRLADELGIDPSTAVQEIERRILLADLPAAPEPAAPTEAGEVATRTVAGLPVPISSYVGQSELLSRVAETLARTRLVTLTGPGGSGKTRTAIETARRDPGPWGDVFFVDLSTTARAELVVAMAVKALGLPEQPDTDPTVLLHEALGNRPALLVLDNCEHVRAAAASLAADLLATCDQLKVLATSREPLGIPGERVRPVPPLQLPAAGDDLESAEAVQLFVTRATDADPAFKLDEFNTDAVIDVCTRLDGLPLALELAAAHVAALTPADIARHLDDRFRILDAADVRPGRQSTLRAAIDGSHALLDEHERLLFERVSLFPGSFDAAAAEAVGAVDTVDGASIPGLLSSLVRRSMVARADTQARHARYRLLDTLRAYGHELLQVQACHRACTVAFVDHFVEVVAAADDRAGADDRWHTDIVTEYHNVQHALHLATEFDVDRWSRMCWRLIRYWTRLDEVVEGLRHVEPLVALPELDERQRARALCGAAELRAEHSEASLAERQASKALAIFETIGDAEGVARAGAALGRALANGGHYAPALERSEQARAWFADHDVARWATSRVWEAHLHLARGDEDAAETTVAGILEWSRPRQMDFLSAKVDWLLGVTARHRGEWVAAREACERALAAFAELDDRSAAAHVRMTMGDIARLADDPETAGELYQMALEALTEIGDRRCTASAIKNLADLTRSDNPSQATMLYVQSLRRRHALGDRVGVAEVLEGIAGALAETNAFGPAATLLACANTIRTDTGSMAPAVERAGVMALRDVLVDRLPASAFSDAWTVGASMSLDDARRCAEEAAEATVLRS